MNAVLGLKEVDRYIIVVQRPVNREGHIRATLKEVKQPSQVTCVSGRAEVLKKNRKHFLQAQDNDLTPSTAWRRDA